MIGIPLSLFFMCSDVIFATRPHNTFWKGIGKVLEGLLKKGVDCIIRMLLYTSFLTPCVLSCLQKGKSGL